MRFAANFVFCSPECILKNGVVEVNDGFVTSVFHLHGEIHSTRFYNGIILPFSPCLSDYCADFDVWRALSDAFDKSGSEVLCSGLEAEKLSVLMGADIFGTKLGGSYVEKLIK